MKRRQCVTRVSGAVSGIREAVLSLCPPSCRKLDGLYCYSLLAYLLRFLNHIKQGRGVGRIKPHALGFCPQTELDVGSHSLSHCA